MYNDELYHYGVPGMRWGHKKQYSTQGGRVRYKIKKQPKQNSEKQENQEKQEATTQQSSRFKKGLIAAGVALAVIGTIIVARKIGQNKSQISVDKKKVSKGKKTVDKLKNKKVSKTKINLGEVSDVFKGLPKPPKPPRPILNQVNLTK